ncbi:ABC transporter ATP-binding protein [Caproiciproducens sp.]|uniref:ABC transporter ATP-binding protein n=1 Tax=Caproiciproducens sp. TaxID=1954376 RepID=UPI0028A09F13|nr:ABC transporter ATP-binding protein [Caproiciproducens sp.]
MNPILRLDKVCKHFGGVVAADDVTFSVMPGEVHGLIGPNGAGKSTLMNLISGIYIPDSGSVFLDEKDISDVPSHMRARLGIGRTFQTPRFLQRSSIRDNMLLGTDLANQMGYVNSYFGKTGADFNAELDDLMKYLDFTFDWEDDISALAYGQRKQLEIVRSMLSHPKIMLVDEPAAGLNNKEIDDVMALLNHAAKDLGIGVLLIEHSMDMIMNICENIVVLCFGKVIAQGVPAEIACNEEVIEAYLGRDMDA